MAVVSRDYLLAEIRRTAEANGGIPLGKRRFQSETGIAEHDVLRYWPRWGDAVSEAGYARNLLQDAYDDEHLLGLLADETRRLGRFPVAAELRVRHTEDPTFPDAKTFQNRWHRGEQVAQLVGFCAERPEYADVLAVVEPLMITRQTAAPSPRVAAVTIGEVYLLRVGRHYKIGRTNSFGRREYELAIQLPERATTVHVIKTDDPVGIEDYWHRRFAAKRANGEWFALTSDDVAAFRRRRFM